MPAAADTLAYRHAGALLVRATTYPVSLPLPDPPDLSGPADDAAAQGLAWLAQLWQHVEVRRVVEVASPVLFEQIHEALAGRPDARRTARLVRSLALYLLRWRGRATPFGLFAGVAPARVEGSAVARWADNHRAVARADALWLGAVIGRIEQHPSLLERLPVVANRCAVVRGEWLVLAGQPPEGRPGVFAPLEVAVRRTGPVRAAMAAAEEPIAFAGLAKRLAVEYPATAPEQISTMLAGLIARHALLAGLRAPMTVPDALGHLQAQLEAVDADDLPDVADVVGELRTIHAELERHNTASAADAAALRADVAGRMRSLCDVAAQPLVVDLALDCDITLPDAAIREAEAAASVLLRLTPYPFGYPHWKDFHTRFRRRYGPGAVVAVRDLVADSGLGFPAGYLGAPRRPAPRTLTRRDETLVALVQQATIEGRDEIVLTERLIRALAVDEETDLVAPPRVELAFQVCAASLDDLNGGRFRLVVTGVPRPASSMAGRFTDLFPAAERNRWADTYDAATDEGADTVAVQLSFPPRQRRDENVTRTGQLLPRVVSLAEHRGPRHEVIEVDDLAVSADARHMHLIQLSTGHRVEARVPHALEGGVHTPPLARFLGEIGAARRAAYTAFDWGAAARMPFLPRLRYGRTVLCPARWLLPAADLPPASATLPDWDAAFTAWRQRWRVPAAVALCEADLRLPVNLDHRAHRALLRTRLDRARQVELREAPTPADLGWFGRAHEILIPLRATGGRPSSPERRRSVGARLCVAARDAAELPGRSAWLHARIYGHPERHNEILTEYAPPLFDGWDDARSWWFTRHRDQARPDADQHLDLFVRLVADDRYGTAAGRVADWAAGLRKHGLLSDLQLASYQPQTGRYGRGPAMAAAEDAFAADSTAALAEIEYATRAGASPDAVTAASLVDLAASYTPTPGEGCRWLIDHLPHEPGVLNPAVRDEALRLADPGRNRATLAAQPGGDRVGAAWHRRRVALAAYHDQLAAQRDPQPVLRSLLHLHHVRAIGVDPDRERITHRLARAAARRWIAQHGTDRS